MKSSPTDTAPLRPWQAGCTALLAAGPWAPAQAHSFGVVYNLPVPFWLYAWASAAALLLSFLIAAYFLQNPTPAPSWRWNLSPGPAARRLISVLRIAAQLTGLLALALAIVTGFWGSSDPYRNPSMTLFWVWWLLAAVYASALLGPTLQALNPWHSLARVAATIPGCAAGQGRFKAPGWFGRWPAVLLLAALLWLELFGGTDPQRLAAVLTAYSALCVAGAWLFGRDYWSRNVELFGVLFDLMGRMAPLHYREQPGRPGRELSISWPFARLSEAPLNRPGEVVLVLLLLAATAYDGLHETVFWSRLYWVDFYQLMTPAPGHNPFQSFQLLRPWFELWQTGWLYLASLIYLLVYGATVAWMRAMAGGGVAFRPLAGAFASTLLPIVLVYHAAHYFTLLQTQGPKLIALLSDPLARGWDLLGTSAQLHYQRLPDAGWVWHTQVALILGGHIISVIAAHQLAIRQFRRPRQALASQIPMLLLMVALTVFGLWILSQPLQAARPG